jgi:hypothetical protein
MKLYNKRGDFSYSIFLDGEQYSIPADGIEIDDEIAEQILEKYGDVIGELEEEEIEDEEE